MMVGVCTHMNYHIVWLKLHFLRASYISKLVLFAFSANVVFVVFLYALIETIENKFYYAFVTSKERQEF